MQIVDNETDQPELRIIKTARNEQAINEAVEQGFWPLVKPVIPSPDIKVKFAVKQDKATGKIKVVHDYRALQSVIAPVNPYISDGSAVESDVVIHFEYYYPYHFENPFAAYLLPQDLQVGEMVVLQDLIEDVVGSSWNQGDTYRLKSCKAVWDGIDFILQHNPDKAMRAIIG
jgi:hypothetical protein